MPLSMTQADMPVWETDYEGIVSSKKLNHGRFEDPYKNKVMARLRGYIFTTEPLAGQTGVAQTYNLMHWKLNDVKDAKFCLMHANGDSVKLRADSIISAKIWVSMLSAAAKKAVQEDDAKRKTYLKEERERAAAELRARQEHEKELKNSIHRIVGADKLHMLDDQHEAAHQANGANRSRQLLQGLEGEGLLDVLACKEWEEREAEKDEMKKARIEAFKLKRDQEAKETRTILRTMHHHSMSEDDEIEEAAGECTHGHDAQHQRQEAAKGRLSWGKKEDMCGPSEVRGHEGEESSSSSPRDTDTCHQQCNVEALPANTRVADVASNQETACGRAAGDSKYGTSEDKLSGEHSKLSMHDIMRQAMAARLAASDMRAIEEEEDEENGEAESVGVRQRIWSSSTTGSTSSVPSALERLSFTETASEPDEPAPGPMWHPPTVEVNGTLDHSCSPVPKDRDDSPVRSPKEMPSVPSMPQSEPLGTPEKSEGREAVEDAMIKVGAGRELSKGRILTGKTKAESVGKYMPDKIVMRCKESVCQLDIATGKLDSPRGINSPRGGRRGATPWE